MSDKINAAIFLDRQGVINKIHYDEDIGLCTPHIPEDFVFIAKVPETIKKINGMGFLAVVVCNQPDISKGRLAQNMHEKINNKMVSDLAACGAKLDGVYYCFHSNEDNCACRKPKPGMLLKAAHELGIDLTRSYIVGDTIADVDAGKNAGCSTILTANPRLDLLNILHERGCEPDYIVKDLDHAVELIMSMEKARVENGM